MSEIPYVIFTGKIKEYFEKFQQVGVPQKAISPWLESIGFKSGNDTYILGVLRYIGFIDSSKVPTELWKNYKDTINAPSTLAKAIKEGYKELFETYPDANKQSRETLYAFFNSKTGKAKGTVDLMVSTFINLCELANFQKVVPVDNATSKEGIQQNGGSSRQISPPALEGLAVNMNIQITLPITEDAKVYENIFKALREQLFKSD